MTEDTEYPNWFKNIQANFLVCLYILKNKKIDCLQIGCYTGDASVWLYDNIILHPESSLTDVDTWEGSDESLHHQMNWSAVESLYDSKTKKARKEKKIIKYKGTSDQFFQNNKKLYDFIYIDGDHTAKQTEIDADNAWECLRSSGILAFDDYEWTTDPDIEKRPKPGINRFLAKHEGQFILMVKNYQLWVIKK
jgi:hypothetical protein